MIGNRGVGTGFGSSSQPWGSDCGLSLEFQSRPRPREQNSRDAAECCPCLRVRSGSPRRRRWDPLTAFFASWVVRIQIQIQPRRKTRCPHSQRRPLPAQPQACPRRVSRTRRSVVRGLVRGIHTPRLPVWFGRSDPELVGFPSRTVEHRQACQAVLPSQFRSHGVYKEGSLELTPGELSVCRLEREERKRASSSWWFAPPVSSFAL